MTNLIIGYIVAGVPAYLEGMSAYEFMMLATLFAIFLKITER